MMRHLFLIVLASLLCSAFGQTTWGGLRFGMTEAQVKAAMKGQIEPTGAEPATPFYWPFRIKSAKVGPATGIAELGFDVKKTLQRVSLDLSRYGDLPEITADEQASRVSAYVYVSSQLLEKYGKPVNETGRCPIRDEAINYLVRKLPDMLTCSRLWSQPSQTIEMKFSLVGNSLFLSIFYKSRSGTPSEL